MKTFWIYGYGGEISKVIANSARRAVGFVDFTIAAVRNSRGDLVTADLWA